jgi:hypothetical protein
VCSGCVKSTKSAKSSRQIFSGPRHRLLIRCLPTRAIECSCGRWGPTVVVVLNRVDRWLLTLAATLLLTAFVVWASHA